MLQKSTVSHLGDGGVQVSGAEVSSLEEQAQGPLVEPIVLYNKLCAYSHKINVLVNLKPMWDEGKWKISALAVVLLLKQISRGLTSLSGTTKC